MSVDLAALAIKFETFGADATVRALRETTNAGDKADKSVGRYRDAMGRLREENGRFVAGAGKTKSAVEGLNVSFGKLGALLGKLGIGLSAGAILGGLVAVNKEYGNLLSQLQTFEGSAAGARAVFKDLEQFAATTPFQIPDVVKAYTTLRTAGITPTMESLRLFGDQAAAFGRSIDDIAVAVRAATTGEFDPLKGFGVQMRVEGEGLVATFQGVETKLARNSAAIVGYLEDISRVNFAGGMERQSQTLGGALSNLEDAVGTLGRAVGDTGLTGAFTSAIQSITAFISITGDGRRAVNDWYDAVLRRVATVSAALEATFLTVRALDPTDTTTFADARAAKRRFQDARTLRDALGDGNRTASPSALGLQGAGASYFTNAFGSPLTGNAASGIIGPRALGFGAGASGLAATGGSVVAGGSRTGTGSASTGRPPPRRRAPTPNTGKGCSGRRASATSAVRR